MKSMKMLGSAVAASLIALVAFAASMAHAGPFSLHKGLQIKRAYTDQFGYDAEEINTITGLNREWYEIDYREPLKIP
jgi:hypothetical protein